MHIYYKNNLPDLFDEMIKLPTCEKKTKAYIISIFSDINNNKDLSKDSITLLYNKALESYSFSIFQNIGDWLFFTKSMFPKSLKNASIEYYNAIASSSYYKCYIIMNRQWLIFEELADQFNSFTKMVNESLRNSSKDRFSFYRLL